MRNTYTEDSIPDKDSVLFNSEHTGTSNPAGTSASMMPFTLDQNRQQNELLVILLVIFGICALT